jgi:hypothetical protein
LADRLDAARPRVVPIGEASNAHDNRAARALRVVVVIEVDVKPPLSAPERLTFCGQKDPMETMDPSRQILKLKTCPKA